MGMNVQGRGLERSTGRRGANGKTGLNANPIKRCQLSDKQMNNGQYAWGSFFVLFLDILGIFIYPLHSLSRIIFYVIIKRWKLILHLALANGKKYAQIS